jgi:uncharacterized protein (DUF427 family)
MTKGHTIATYPVSERVRVMVDGEALADSSRAVALDETGLPTRYYVPRDDVRLELLTPTETATNCPFKGDAVYWSARVGAREIRDIAWSYPDPIAERRDIAGYICFFAERVDSISVGNVSLERPETQWSTVGGTSG